MASAVLIGLAVSFVLAELLLRVVYRRLPPGDNWEPLVMCRDSRYNYKFMIPGKESSMFTEDGQIIDLKANSNGYRDSEWASKKKPAVLVLGDSFGWGWGSPADSMITKRLEEAFPDHSFFNLCIPGDDLYRQYARFRYHEAEIDPSHIVILHYVNDLFDIEGQRKKQADAIEKDLFAPDRKGPMVCDVSLDDDNPFKRFVKNLYVTKLAIRYMSSKAVSREEGLRQGYRDDVTLLTDSSRVDSAFAFYSRLIPELAAKRPVTLVYIPPIYQADDGMRKEILDVHGNPVIHPEWVNRRFDETAGLRPNLRFVDLTDTLRTENRRSPLYFKYDGHLTGRGQSVAGSYLAARLRGILQPETSDTSGSIRQSLR